MNSQEHIVAAGRPGKMTKIDRYGWTLKDEPGQLLMVNKHTLKVDAQYQRDLVTKRVQALASEWSWVACGAIQVARRAAGLYVMDGQHRVAAALSRADITNLPCLVFNVTSLEEEASGFLSANTNRRPMNTLEQFKARLVKGDEAALLVQAILEFHGVRLVKDTKTPRTTKSIKWCLDAVQADESAFRVVIETASRISAESPIKIRLLEGLWWLHKNGYDLTQRRIRNRLDEVGARRLIEGADKAAAFRGQGGGVVCAEGMLNEMNKNLHNKLSPNK